MLRMDVEAISDYENILKENSDYVPALLGNWVFKLQMHSH